MQLETIIKGTPVSLSEILEAREARVFRQQELLKAAAMSEYSLISFTMNIAGNIKAFPLCLAAFDEGLKELKSRIPSDKIIHFEESKTNSGPEAFFLVSLPAKQVKTLTTAIEESHPIGRLFDMDVLDSTGASMSRSVLNLPPRKCLICGELAKACARSRNHTLEVILWRTAQILNDFFKGRAADAMASCAVRALLYEVSTTPKPGLVDRNNSGSHNDMDFFTFVDSSAALIPWFRDFFCLGWEHCSESDSQLFSRLRFAGQEAETSMFMATNHINTHKGLIFAFAIILGALGKAYAIRNSLNTTETVPNTLPINLAVPCDEIRNYCKKLAQHSLSDFSNSVTHSSPQTFGQLQHKTYGLTGARGEAAAGFPAVFTYGLPALKCWLNQGLTLNDSSALALISLLAYVNDTNMIHRGGFELANKSKADAKSLLDNINLINFKESLIKLDSDYIKDNLSPGGCADLLAISLLFLFLEQRGLVQS